ncbi:MAG: hypothetical protein J7J22_03775 [Candidatus Verstraetearchaeota archaeon]|nr:hypothetical protein [Candidatus Verstraetearchaeota archaeon]
MAGRLVAGWVAEKLGLDNYYAEILPHGKAEIIRRIQSEGLRVAMMGDGLTISLHWPRQMLE